MPGRKLSIKIFGAGVGGLTAAHMLCDHASIDIYEMKDTAGGLARSCGPKCNTYEISWRVYFHFYKHLLGLMKEIPADNRTTVFDHLIPYKNTFVPKKSLKEILNITQIWKIHGLLTASDKRLDSYDKYTWRNFINSDFAEIPQWLGLDRFKGSTTSVERIGIEQSVIAGVDKDDYVLDGPTNNVWINPWVQELRKRGVRFHFRSKVEKVVIDKKTRHVQRVRMEDGNILQADLYILALPIESLSRVAADLVPQAPLLAKQAYQVQLAFQMHLERPLSLGYQQNQAIQSFLLRDSAWSLIVESKTISWNSRYTENCGTTQWSATVCQYDVPGILIKKPLIECTEQEAHIEILAQLESSKDLMLLLKRENKEFDGKLRVMNWKTMSDTYMFGPPMTVSDPKFSNNAGTKIIRPSIFLGPNVYLSTAYAKETIDVFSMEAAVISGKTVAASIVGGSPPVHPSRPFRVLNVLRATDEFLFFYGLPDILTSVTFVVIIILLYLSVRLIKRL